MLSVIHTDISSEGSQLPSSRYGLWKGRNNFEELFCTDNKGRVYAAVISGGNCTNSRRALEAVECKNATKRVSKMPGIQELKCISLRKDFVKLAG